MEFPHSELHDKVSSSTSDLPSISNPDRPRQKFRTNPLDQFPSKSYGNAITHKSEQTVRLFFQNVHGLSSSSGSEDYRYLLHSLQSFQIDVAGLAETKTCWQHSHLRGDFNNVVRRFHRQSKTVFGSPSQAVDPIPISETHQAGRTITMVVGCLVSQVNGQHLSDPTGLGRWSSVTISGSDSQNSRCSQPTVFVVAPFDRFHLRVHLQENTTIFTLPRNNRSIHGDFSFAIFNNKFSNFKRMVTPLLSCWTPMQLCNPTTTFLTSWINAHCLISMLMIRLHLRILVQQCVASILS